MTEVIVAEELPSSDITHAMVFPAVVADEKLQVPPPPVVSWHPCTSVYDGAVPGCPFPPKVTNCAGVETVSIKTIRMIDRIRLIELPANSTSLRPE